MSTVQANKNAELVIRDNFEFPAHLKIHYRIFIIILSLSVLIFWKLINYLARFKIAENHSRLEIVFVCAFFALVLTPALKISQDEKSMSENRMLAVYDPFTKEGKINNSFGKNFDLWFNDRFLGRKELITINDSLKNIFNRKLENVKAFAGKDHWMFYKGDSSVENYANIHLFSDNDLLYIADYLSSIQEWCDNNNKKFYFLICPDKNKIYGEFYPDFINKVNPDDKSRANQLISYLNENTKVKTIYPYSELKKHKTDHLLYYMNDTHWSPFGSYIGYSELMKAVNENYNMEVLDLKNMKITKVAGCWSGYGDLMIKNGLFNYSKMVQYPELRVDYEKNSMEGMEKDDEYYYTKKGKHSIFFFRDSFATDMRPYIANTFERSFFRRYDLNKQDLGFMKENFDIIVFEIVERYLPIISAMPLSFPDDSRSN
ncbi:MAG TPA: DHHW family protein [Spirochaetota bacterium]|nr:DHHW family protein [Spirochaetota bacterium]HOR45545.1 DHHW family protein [Spirochaetota bacterium]HPK57128.1 DHHW family protein [Spirochaetota bacterium]